LSGFFYFHSAVKEQRIELPECTIIARADGILHIAYTDIFLHLEDSKRIFRETRSFSPWEKAPLFLSGTGFTNQDKASRDFNGSPEVLKHCSAIAFHSPSLAQKILANFFIKMMRPSVPTRFFTTEEDAINWLKNYL